jgi:hypothetical protein
MDKTPSHRMFARMGGWLRPLALVTAVCPLVAWAVTPEEAEQLLKDLSPGIEIKSVTPSEVPGFVLLEITGGAFLHMTPDGKHFFAGDLYRVGPDGLTNVMEDKRNLARKSLIDSVDESEMLVFAPPSKSLKATVTVFTRCRLRLLSEAASRSSQVECTRHCGSLPRLSTKWHWQGLIWTDGLRMVCGRSNICADARQARTKTQSAQLLQSRRESL